MDITIYGYDHNTYEHTSSKFVKIKEWAESEMMVFRGSMYVSIPTLSSS